MSKHSSLASWFRVRLLFIRCL